MRMDRLWKAFADEPYMAFVAAVAFLLFAGSLLVTVFGLGDPYASDLARRFQAPSWIGGDGGILGTDQLGRSIAIRLAHGLTTSYVVGLGAVAVGSILGISLGMVAGFFGGRLDGVIMRAADVQIALPTLLLTMILVVALGGHAWVLIVVLGAGSWMIYARVLRNVVVGMKRTDFVRATAALGATRTRIILRHLVPNTVAQMSAVATLELGRLMLSEASLSFLGFGIAAPSISVGRMLSEGRQYLISAWWLAAFSGLLLTAAALSANLLGNWITTVLDPLDEKSRSL